MDKELIQPAPITPETASFQSENILVQPISPSPKSKLPLILIVIILLIIVGLSGIFLGKYFFGSKFYVTVQPVVSPIPTQIPIPTSVPTANWKTYTNTKYNYSVKYPTNWYIHDKGSLSQDGKKYEHVQEMTFISPKQGENLGSADLVTNSFMIRGDFTAFNETDLTKGGIKLEKVNINGIDITKAIFSVMTSPFTNYYFQHNGLNFQIAIPDQDSQGTHEPIFDQILSTFKFTQ